LISLKKNSPTIFEKISFRLRIFYEILTGVDFTKVIPVKDLGLDPEIVVQSSPTTVKYIYKVLDYLKISKNKKILDIGSGKGYLIKFLNNLGYCKVDGLEISQKLAIIARKNFKKINVKTKIFNTDAKKFKFYGKYDVFYLYNPFPEKIAAHVFSSIKSQITKFNKRFYVIYTHPVAHKTLIKNGFVLKKNFRYIGEYKIGVYFYN
jgi:16S rRNA A1518/A1519 N6-dimethyltransferase RsmA/KsgA/DIM1 with predicted DNA glycosylase/AP lyase activity